MVTEAPVAQSDGNTAFLRAARAGNLDKVLEHLKSDVDINTANANGLNALHLASKEGHTHVVTELLSRGATVDASTKKGNTALHIASLAGQEEVVRLLVQHGAAVNVQSQNGFTPLYMAAQENHDNVVKFLLANGANQSLATEDGFTPLAVAMQQGHDKVVAVLLENDTRGKVRLPALHIAAKKDDCKAAALLLQNEHNPDVTSKSGFTPLHIAAHYGNEAIANLLLSKGADVNYSAKHNISPLHVAAKWGKSNLVALLLERGAHIEAKTRDGLTPLHCAARSGHEQVVDMMLERGAPISCKTKNGLAPLHMAAQGDHVDAARILLYHRAPVDEITVDYLTALHVAAHCGHVRVAKLLLDRKADPNARALNGFTPLHIACKKNRIKVVELLLKHGASIEATTESGLTPLHVASFMGCMNIVIYLLQNEANPDVPTVRGETPLHLAARANQTDIIRILLRNGAQVDARAREQQTPLHIASRLGNVDIVMLLLQHGAAVDSTTKDLYTALHIAAKEGQEEVAAVLLENGASLTSTTNKGCTPLHLAAKYGNMKVARLLLQKDAPVDSQGKNGVTPLHVASHYDHQNVALLLLDKGASPHATAKNGHTPLHIAARKNQMDIATTLLEYGAKANAESRAGFTPLHLSAQEGHTDMSTLLIEHQADTNHQAKNGLTPLHLCAQEDRVNVAQILVKNGANVDSTTKAGYTPLHVASHFGQVNMVRFLLQHGADTSAVTSVGYTPLHQAAQQGHSGVVSTLLNSGAQPNVTTKQGQTALSIAQKLGYISVVETLKVVTEVTTITTTTTTTIEEKYRVVAPETMQETFMSDSEEEGGEDTLLNEQPYHYLTVDEMKSLGDDSLPIDVTQDDRHDSNRDLVSPQHVKEVYTAQLNYASDNVDISRHPVNVGFLVSFLVDARGGAMRGCRHSGVRVIVPPRKAPQPLRVTCRYLKRDKLSHPPPLMEGEALASRILELGPVGAKFLGPVIIEVPHFGSLRGREREIVILRSDNGETWREHTVEASEDAVHDVLNESFEKDELSQLEVCDSGRLTRILTTDFPQYFAVVSRVRQEVHAIGPEGGMVSSSVVPQVQAVFPQGALTKKIKVGLQAQPIAADLVAKLLGNRVAVSPIVTVEPRRRKFHKPITLTIPVPQAANKGMINQYSGDAPTLRLLCSITGGTTRAQWEDVTGSTPLTFVNDCVSFTTTVSARFWLMDCRNISEATKMATELYKEAIHVPFLAKFVVFAKRVDFLEARLRVFCMTDDKEDKTLEHQEHFTEVAKSRDVEVLEGKGQFVEFAGNLVPVTKSGDQLQLGFRGFRENRLAFTTRVKDPHADPVGRILFMKEAKVQKGDPPQQPVCVLNIVLPDDIIPESSTAESTPQKQTYSYSFTNGSAAPARPELRLSDISNTLGSDWESLAVELGLSRSQVERIKSDHPAAAAPQHAMAMLKLWLQKLGNKASGVELQQALQRLGRDDIIHRCMISCDDQEMSLTSSHLGLDQSGFDNLREELGVSRDVSRETSLRRNFSLEAGAPYDEHDIMKDSESVEELVEKQIPSIERIGEIKQIEKRHGEQEDNEERKYIAEEKEVEEKRKSVRERKEEIEKRLSQTSMDELQQRRDSQLFQGVSEGLERLNITEPSQAQVEPNWQETKVSSTTTTITSEQHPGSQGGADDFNTQPTTIEGSLDAASVNAPQSTFMDKFSRPIFGEASLVGPDINNRKSVVEEIIVKTAVPPPPRKESDGKFEKEDRKKEKKEKEKEEKDRKKREKKEKELKEKEEKERKEREKKERKEQEKREKEERQRREKEEKKNKSQKEKADKEKMEKEKKGIFKGLRSVEERSGESEKVVEDTVAKKIKETPPVSFANTQVEADGTFPIATAAVEDIDSNSLPLNEITKSVSLELSVSDHQEPSENQEKEKAVHPSVFNNAQMESNPLSHNEQGHSVEVQVAPSQNSLEISKDIKSAPINEKSFDSSPSQHCPKQESVEIKNDFPFETNSSVATEAYLVSTSEHLSKKSKEPKTIFVVQEAVGKEVPETKTERVNETEKPFTSVSSISAGNEISFEKAATYDRTPQRVIFAVDSSEIDNKVLPSTEQGLAKSAQKEGPKEDLNIPAIKKDIQDIIDAAAAAVALPEQMFEKASPSVVSSDNVISDSQAKCHKSSLTETPFHFKLETNISGEGNGNNLQQKSMEKIKEADETFEAEKDAGKGKLTKNPLESIPSNSPLQTSGCSANLNSTEFVESITEMTPEPLLDESNPTSKITTTFKTEKISAKPGMLPNVVNTVTEKVISTTGLPEQVITTVTDKKFSDSGKPDQVTTTITEKIFSETGRPDKTITTVTEKIFTEMGKPNKITHTVVTETIGTKTDPAGQPSTIKTQEIIVTETPGSPLLDDAFLRDTPKITVASKETTKVASSSVPVSETAANNESCYVTTPTMQRRAHSQRRTGDERPAPIDVSYLQNDESDDEEYIVTEPLDEGRVEDRFRINSSPEILHLTHSSRETRKLSPDSNRVKFQLGSLDSQDSMSSDPTTPITPISKIHKFTVEKVEEESLAKPLQESNLPSVAKSTETPDASSSDPNKKLRRVERHFERMASQSLAEGTTPVRDVDFQRVVSQLSQEEVAVSEDEYENLLAQVTTPSDEWDSQGGTDESPEALEAAMLQTSTVHERSPVPTFLFSQSSEDREVSVDSDEEPNPAPVPSTVFWSFDDRPLRASSVSLDELGLPLTEPAAAGEALSHWENTDHLDLSVEEPALPAALPRLPNRSASVVEELLRGDDTIPAPLARSVLRSTCFPDILEVPCGESQQEPETPAFSRPHMSIRKSVPLSRSPLGLLLQDRLAEAPDEDADSVEEKQ